MDCLLKSLENIWAFYKILKTALCEIIQALSMKLCATLVHKGYVQTHRNCSKANVCAVLILGTSEKHLIKYILMSPKCLKI